MKCPKCEKECNESNSIASNAYICPFCGHKFSQNGDERKNVNQVIKNLVEVYGIEILEDSNRMNALLMDYIPHSDKERKLIILVIREGIVSLLRKIMNDTKENQKFGLNKCVRQLVENLWITETAAKYAVTILATIIGINVDFATDEQVSQEQAYSLREDSTKNFFGKIFTKEIAGRIKSEDEMCSVLKEYVAIGYKAFAANVNIKQLELPTNINVIYPKAFLNCIHLCRITLPEELKNIGTCAFEGCSKLEKIDIIDGFNYKVIDGVLIDKMNKRALRVENDTSKTVVKIANGVSIICKKAFERSPVKCIVIPMSVKQIEENAFFLTQHLERFEVDVRNSNFKGIDGVLHNKKESILVRYPQGKKNVGYYLEDTVVEIGTQAFSCVYAIQAVTFTGSLKKIGNKAFEYCMNLENLVLPGNVEIIGDRAFQYCEKMRSIMLSKSIQEIGDCAFFNCVSLETISIPKSVSKIGNLAFANCYNLKRIIIQENVSFVGDGAFVGCKDVEIHIKNNSYMETYCRTREIKFMIM